MTRFQQFVREGFLDQPLCEKIQIVIFYSGFLSLAVIFAIAAHRLH